MGNIINMLRLAASLSGQPDTDMLLEKQIEQYQDSVKTEIVEESNPIKFRTETGTATNTEKPVYFQRAQVSNGFFEVKYDNITTGSDALRLKITPTNDIGAAFYNIGDWKGEDVNYLEAWKTFKVGDADAMIDGGVGFGNKTEPLAWGILKYETDNIMLEGAMFNKAKELGDLEQSFYGAAGFDFGKVHIGAGTNKNIHEANLTIKDFEDIGSLTFATYDKETGDVFFKSQTGIGNPDENFFSNYIADFTAEYFGIPPFFGVHFSPSMTKADYTIAISGKIKDESTQLEGILGLRNDVLNVGVGLDNLNKDGENNTNLAMHLHKDFDIAGVNGYGEVKYSARTGDVSGYLIVNYELK